MTWLFIRRRGYGRLNSLGDDALPVSSTEKPSRYSGRTNVMFYMAVLDFLVSLMHVVLIIRGIVDGEYEDMLLDVATKVNISSNLAISG